MKLITKNLHRIHTKSRAVSQVTFDEDYNVPDARPDVGRMIQKKGEIQIQDVQVSENKAVISGAMKFYLLYVTDTQERRVCSMNGVLDFTETLNLEGLNSGDKVCLKWDLEDLTIHVINSRKLNIKALVTFQASVDEIADVPVPVDVEESADISRKSKGISILGLGVYKKDTLRTKKEIVIASSKPNVHEILWNDVEVRGLDIRADENKVIAKGELFVFVLYAGDDENNPLQWVEQSIPFQGEVACEGCSLEMLPNIEVSMLQSSVEVKPDADGEERIIRVEAVMELDMKMYEEQPYALLQDVYTPKKECIITREAEPLESLLVRNYSKCRVSERVEVPQSSGKILQICHSDGVIKLDDVRIAENGIEAEGVIQVRILYIVSDDEMPFYSTEASVPFRHMIEAPDICPNCRYHLRTDLEQLSTNMADSNEIEVKAVLNLNVLVLNQESREIIRGIEEKEPDMEKIKNMPGIVCYIVQPQDTLWDIARAFYTTVEDIKKLNDLSSEEVSANDRLILVKKVE